MKKILENIGFALIALLATTLVVSNISKIYLSEKEKCHNPNQAVAETVVTNTNDDKNSGIARIKEAARVFNKSHSQTFDDSDMPCVHNKVDESSKLYIYEYLWNEDVCDISKLNQLNLLNHEARMDIVLLEMKTNPESLEFMKLLAKENFEIVFKVEGNKTHKIIENKVSSAEIAKMIDLAND